MFDVKLPQTSEVEQESVIVFWHKSEGDTVKKGEILVEVQTEKAIFEIEAEENGLLKEILVSRGEVAHVGDTLATIATEAEVSLKGDNVPKGDGKIMESHTKQTNGIVFVRAAPRVRKVAIELGVDLAMVNGTGKNGQPTEEDVRRAALRNDIVYVESIPFSGTRKTIANRMQDSLQNTAQLTVTAWADVTLLDNQRNEMMDKPSWNDLLLYTVTKALQEHQNMNAHVYDEEIRQFKNVHLGVAVDTDDGLFVPVIKNADTLSLLQLKENVRKLVRKARSNKLSPDEVSGATFTVTNLGSLGIQFFTPILNKPEAAILGVGKLETYLVLIEGKVVERKRLPLSLTFDHRAIDGTPAAKFLQSIIKNLQEPSILFEEEAAK